MKNSFRVLYSIAISISLFSSTYAQQWVVTNQFPSPTQETGGLAWDGVYLWAVDGVANRFFKINPKNGNILQEFTLDPGPGVDIEDLAFGNGFLFAHIEAFGVPNKIFKINPNTGALVETWNYNVGNNGQGLAYDSTNNAVWAVQGRSGSTVVSTINLVQGNTVLASIHNDILIAEGDPPDGISYDETTGILYIVNNAAEIFLLDVQTQTILSSFQGPGGIGQGPEGLAWDGQYLWFADIQDDMIYQLALIDTTEKQITLDAVTNCIDLLSTNENNNSKSIKLTLVQGKEYRITVAGQAYNDPGNSPMTGVHMEYYNSIGLRDAIISSGNHFAFTNTNSDPDNFLLYLVDRDPSDNVGSFTVLIERDFMTSVSSTETQGKVETLYLKQNYPNPFNPTTTIEYEVPMSGMIKLEIFNVLGQKIKTVIDERKTIGRYKVIWDGTNDLGEKVSNGNYFYTLRIDNQVEIKKMIFLK